MLVAKIVFGILLVALLILAVFMAIIKTRDARKLDRRTKENPVLARTLEACAEVNRSSARSWAFTAVIVVILLVSVALASL